MVFQSVPETVEITVNAAIHGRNVQNTYHARRVGGYVLSDLENLAADVAVLVDEVMKPAWSTDTVFGSVEVRGLANENDFLVVDTSEAGAGTAAGAALPNNVAFAVRRLSGFTGRSARGRVFWYGLNANALSTAESVVTPTWRGIMVSAVDSVRELIASLSPWTPVIVSRYSGGEQRELGITFSWITTSSFSDRVDTQRGRLGSEG